MKLIFRIFLSLIIINSNYIRANTIPNVERETAKTESSSEIAAFNEGEFKSYVESKAIPPDWFHLIGQKLTLNNQNYSLIQLGESPLSIFYTDLKLGVEGSNFTIIGYNNGVEVARHTFVDLNVHSFQMDAEMLVLATKEGKIHAIDMVYLKKNLFKGPIPVYQNLISDSEFKEPFKMNFWTRGVSPSIIENISDDSKSIFPHNRQGEIYFKAGDLILHRGEGNNDKAFSILSREVLLKEMVVQSEKLLVTASLFSPEVFEKIDPQLIQKLATVFDPKAISIDDVSREAIRAVPSSSLEKLYNQINQLATSDRDIDKATLDEWIKSYRILQQEASRKNIILEPNQDLSSVWQELMKSHLDANKETIQQPGFFKKYGMALAILSGISIGAGSLYLMEVKPVLLAIDYLYNHAVPPILKVPEYRFPLLASVTALVSIIPLVQLVAWMSPYMMKAVARSLQLSSKNLADKMFAIANKWSEMNTWQRLVTFGARAQSGLTISFWNHIASILRQPQFFRTLKSGMNPFSLINAESSLGKKLNLEKDLFFGINNPFAKKEDLEKTAMMQQQAAQVVGQEKLQARFAAFQLVALILYQNKKIDPVTLRELFEGELKGVNSQLSEYQNLTQDQKKEWLALTEIISKDWIQSVRSKGKLFEQVSPEEFLILFKVALKKIDRFQNASLLNERYLIFKDQANRYLKQFGQNTILLGVEDGQFLGKVYANTSTSKQVKQVFESDHLISAIYPPFWGDRANPNKATVPGGAEDGSDRNLLTFRPKDGSLSNLYTNPEHMMDIWINVAAHFFGGASRYILLYQKEPPTSETKYQPIEHLSIQQTHENESALKGTKNWILNAADTRQSALGDFYIKTLKKQISTIQAGLILGVTFRMISLDPTIEFAVTSWYLFFVAGVWSYAWPWTIIGQGNHLENERLNGQAKRLLDIQIKLSQALRFGEFTKIVPLTRELNELYSSDSSRKQRLIEILGMEPTDHSSNEYSDWSRKLLQYSESSPPFATKPNPIPSWIATWTGAITTTMMAISLGVFSLDPSNLTLSTLLFETAKAGALYTASYYLIGKSGFASHLLNNLSQIVEYYKVKKSFEKNGKEISKNLGAGVCRQIFKF